MKTIINLILSILFAGIGTISAQVMPDPPPPPPAPPVAPQVDSESNYSITVNSSDTESGENISYSLTNTDDTYKVRGRFPKRFSEEIKSYILEEMGRSKMNTSGNKTSWKAVSNGDEVYEITTSPGKLNMFIDKEVASNNLIEKFGEMGLYIKDIISEDDSNKNEVERLERDAVRLRMDAERMLQEAERLKKQHERESDRARRESDRAERESQRLEREAARLAREVEKAERMSAHRGGMDSSVREVLHKETTFFDTSNAQNKNGWIWPAFQQDLILSLESDELVGEDNELVFVRDASGIYVNGNKMNNSQEDAYTALFKKHGIASTGYFTFYKLYDHIMVINSDAKILAFFDELKDKGEISSTKKPVKIAINGDSVVKDGVALSSDKVSMYNKLLTKYNIIPVPGKVIQLMKKGSYKLGYSIGERTHIGTWGMVE